MLRHCLLFLCALALASDARTQGLKEVFLGHLGDRGLSVAIPVNASAAAAWLPAGLRLNTSRAERHNGTTPMYVTPMSLRVGLSLKERTLRYVEFVVLLPGVISLKSGIEGMYVVHAGMNNSVARDFGALFAFHPEKLSGVAMDDLESFVRASGPTFGVNATFTTDPSSARTIADVLTNDADSAAAQYLRDMELPWIGHDKLFGHVCSWVRFDATVANTTASVVRRVTRADVSVAAGTLLSPYEAGTRFTIADGAAGLLTGAPAVLWYDLQMTMSPPKPC